MNNLVHGTEIRGEKMRCEVVVFTQASTWSKYQPVDAKLLVNIAATGHAGMPLTITWKLIGQQDIREEDHG